MQFFNNNVHTVFAIALIALSALIIAGGNFTGLALGSVGAGILVAEKLDISFIYVSYGMIALGGLFIILQAMPDPSILTTVVGVLMIVLSGREVLRVRTEEHSFTDASRSK